MTGSDDNKVRIWSIEDFEKEDDKFKNKNEINSYEHADKDSNKHSNEHYYKVLCVAIMEHDG